MALIQMNDSFILPSTSWVVSEPLDEKLQTPLIVDGVGILARMRGPAFLVEDASKNKRFYTRKLWENVRARNEERIQAHRMLGTIGHDQSLSEKDLLMGVPTHVVHEMWIDEDYLLPDGRRAPMGMSEFWILGTDGGKQLNAYARAGVRFPISSRAYGEFRGAHPSGAQIINEDSYLFETFDFVWDQGVSVAIPSLVRESITVASMNPVGTLTTTSGTVPNTIGPITFTQTQPIHEDFMTTTVPAEDQVLRSMTESKLRVESDLQNALHDNETLRVKLGVKEDKIAAFMESAQTQTQQLNQMRESLDAVNAKLKLYEAFGTVEEIQSVLESGNKLVDQVQSLGSYQELQEALNALSMYEELGDVRALKQHQLLLGKYKRLGSLDDLVRGGKLLEQYIALGSPQEIERAFRITESYVQRNESRTVDTYAQELSETYSIDIDVVKDVLSSVKDRNKVKRLLESMAARDKGQQVRGRYRVDESVPAPKKSMNEDSTATDTKENLRPMSERLMSRYTIKGDADAK